MGEPRLPVYGREKPKRLPKDLTGRRFGKLVVQSWVPEFKKWLCQCDCGGTCNVKRTGLIAGRQSCGCLSRMYYGKRARLPFHDIENHVQSITQNKELT